MRAHAVPQQPIIGHRLPIIRDFLVWALLQCYSLSTVRVLSLESQRGISAVIPTHEANYVKGDNGCISRGCGIVGMVLTWL